MEGYEGVAVISEGVPPQTPPVGQGRTLEPAMDVLDGGWVGGGEAHPFPVVVSRWMWDIIVTLLLFLSPYHYNAIS